MRFGVIICPKCKQIKGVQLSSKTTKCIRCGTTLQMKKLKIFYMTDSQEKLRQMIGVLNAETEKNSGTFQDLLCKK